MFVFNSYIKFLMFFLKLYTKNKQKVDTLFFKVLKSIEL